MLIAQSDNAACAHMYTVFGVIWMSNRVVLEVMIGERHALDAIGRYDGAVITVERVERRVHKLVSN